MDRIDDPQVTAMQHKIVLSRHERKTLSMSTEKNKLKNEQLEKFLQEEKYRTKGMQL